MCWTAHFVSQTLLHFLSFYSILIPIEMCVLFAIYLHFDFDSSLLNSDSDFDLKTN